MVSYKEIVKQEILTDQLKLVLRTFAGETPLNVDFEAIQDPKPEILLQAKLQFCKKRIFDFIQGL